MDKAITVKAMIELLGKLDPDAQLAQDGDPVIGVRTIDNHYPGKEKTTEVEFIFADEGEDEDCD